MDPLSRQPEERSPKQAPIPQTEAVSPLVSGCITSKPKAFLSADEIAQHLNFQTPLPSETFLTEEAQFHARWKGEINLEKRKDYLRSWAQALKGVGTPLSFCDEAGAAMSKEQLYGGEYPYVVIENGAYERRAQFMLLQPAYKPLLPTEQYPFAADFEHCKLCQTIAWGTDRQLFGGGDPIFIADLGDSVLLPNRYPNSAGSSLLLPKQHDNLSNRNVVERDLRTGHCTFPLDEGKTFGNLLSVNTLHLMMALSDQLDMVGLRNHPLEGMSVPLHDHFQLYFSELGLCSVLRAWASAAQDSNLGSGVLPASYTPFDTLVLRGERAEIAELGSRITQRLEQDQQVFTLAYYGGCFYISPRYPGCYRSQAGALGSSTILHARSPTDPIYWDKIERFVPRKGEFPWAQYLDS